MAKTHQFMHQKPTNRLDSEAPLLAFEIAKMVGHFWIQAALITSSTAVPVSPIINRCTVKQISYSQTHSSRTRDVFCWIIALMIYCFRQNVSTDYARSQLDKRNCDKSSRLAVTAVSPRLDTTDAKLCHDKT